MCGKFSTIISVASSQNYFNYLTTIVRMLVFSVLLLVLLNCSITSLGIRLTGKSSNLLMSSTINFSVFLIFIYHRLPPDLGLFDGPKPVIMDVANTQELVLMLQGAKRSSRIEFGGFIFNLQ